ncbi:MAG: NfeD family protein [Treponema sp.]
MLMYVMNSLPWFWLLLMVALLAVEAFTFSLTTVWGALACIPLIFIARTPLAFKWQLLIFVTLTLVLLIFTRPLAVKKLKISKTNVNELAGQTVIVVKKIGTIEKGEVKSSSGVVWSAKSQDGSEIAEGTPCLIAAVTGNTLEVKVKKGDTGLSSQQELS